MSDAAPATSISRHRLLPMRGRDPRQHHRQATPLELLFDLTFVVAFAQAGTSWRTTSPRGTSRRA